MRPKAGSSLYSSLVIIHGHWIRHSTGHLLRHVLPYWTNPAKGYHAMDNDHEYLKTHQWISFRHHLNDERLLLVIALCLLANSSHADHRLALASAG